MIKHFLSRTSHRGLMAILLTAVVILPVGCVDGPTNGITLAGCPDGKVQQLVIREGVVREDETDFLAMVNRTDQKLVVVDLWATWCGPCRMLAPQLKALKKEWGDKIEVVKVDVDTHPGIAQHFGADSIPDVRIFRGGTQVGSFVGVMPSEDIASLLKSLE